MNFDQSIVEWLNHNRIRPLDDFFIFITDTASFVAYSITAIILIYAFYKRQTATKLKGLQILCSILLSTLVVTVIKNIIKRQRPYEIDMLIEKLSVGGGFSFPSGHTADAFVMATSVSLLLTKKKWWLFPLWIWALMIAYSRILLGVHYLSDVLASMVIGVFIAFLMHLAFKGRVDYL